MSEETIQKLRQRKQVLDDQLNTAFSKDLNDFIMRSNENFRRVMESNRQHWIQLAEQELAQGEADAKKGDRISAITHSMAADNYLSLANIA